MKDTPPITTELTSRNVHAILAYCLFNEGGLPEIPEETRKSEQATIDFLKSKEVACTFGEGVMLHALFHQGRLEEKAPEIKDMLRQLPKSFDAHGEEKGHSFLSAYMNRDGNLWGQHRDMDALFVLGIGPRLATSSQISKRWGGSLPMS